MADHSVSARDESNGIKASEAFWMFCVDNAFPEKSCFVFDLVLLFRTPDVFFVPECHRNRVESSTAEKVFFYSVSPFASEEKARSS